MRHIPRKLSATQRWRTGRFVTGLMALPFRMIAPVGAVSGLSGSTDAANCVVEVVGVTVFCAWAVRAIKMTIEAKNTLSALC